MAVAEWIVIVIIGLIAIAALVIAIITMMSPDEDVGPPGPRGQGVFAVTSLPWLPASGLKQSDVIVGDVANYSNEDDPDNNGNVYEYIGTDITKSTSWKLSGNILGPQGDEGPQGPQGDQGPPGAAGNLPNVIQLKSAKYRWMTNGSISTSTPTSSIGKLAFQTFYKTTYGTDFSDISEAETACMIVADNIPDIGYYFMVGAEAPFFLSSSINSAISPEAANYFVISRWDPSGIDHTLDWPVSKDLYASGRPPSPGICYYPGGYFYRFTIVSSGVMSSLNIGTRYDNTINQKSLSDVPIRYYVSERTSLKPSLATLWRYNVGTKQLLSAVNMVQPIYNDYAEFYSSTNGIEITDPMSMYSSNTISNKSLARNGVKYTIFNDRIVSVPAGFYPRLYISHRCLYPGDTFSYEPYYHSTVPPNGKSEYTKFALTSPYPGYKLVLTTADSNTLAYSDINNRATNEIFISLNKTVSYKFTFLGVVNYLDADNIYQPIYILTGEAVEYLHLYSTS